MILHKISSISLNRNIHISLNLANKALQLYKFLLRECEKLPEAPRKHYKFMLKQSFIQHKKETDSERIQQIIQRAYEDADWILKKSSLVPRGEEDAMKVPLATSSRPVALEKFYCALQLYHERPHIVNRKLCGATTLLVYKISYTSSSHPVEEVVTNFSISYEVAKLEALTRETLGSLVKDLLQPYDKNVEIQEVDWENFKEVDGVLITVQVLFPSFAISSNTVQLTIWDKRQHSVSFVSSGTKNKYELVAPPFAYKFQVENSGLLQLIVDNEDADSASGEWLAAKLFPKVLKWSEEFNEAEFKPSLSLVSVAAYCKLYKELKNKYGRRMIEMWPEVTDPLKFVYEDIAIASYLICLWHSVPMAGRKQSFVDLGCGNGLLVFILSEEGFPGVGIDIRRRKIWDLYPASTRLETRSIEPSDAYLFPDADWIIGNHSDELTPWIPVISARSSCNFFLLPCCCYNFDGSKYNRRNASVSQYCDYLQYIKAVCDTCGFITKSDRLRIPSTKRTCFVSFGRKNNFDSYQVEQHISALIGQNHRERGEKWVQEFKAREPTERVRNCTQLQRDFISKIVNKLVSALLAAHEGEMRRKRDGTVWNAGGELGIAELVKHLDVDELKGLKSECGGLQTLLKNHRYIFEVSKGAVKLRLPYLRKDTDKYTEKSCWFYKNHPQQCLHTDVDCAYSHVA